jgi:hypothetical protein
VTSVQSLDLVLKVDLPLSFVGLEKPPVPPVPPTPPLESASLERDGGRDMLSVGGGDMFSVRGGDMFSVGGVILYDIVLS